MMSLYEFDGFDCQIWVNAMVQCIDVCSRCENEELPYDSARIEEDLPFCCVVAAGWSRLLTA